MSKENLVDGKEFAKRLDELEKGVDYIDLAKREVWAKTIWILPKWAADVIMDTLARDARSSFIDESIQKEIANAYNEVKEVDYEKVKTLISTIFAEVRPLEGHTDPGAIQDCWNELMHLLGMTNGKYPHRIESFDM